MERVALIGWVQGDIVDELKRAALLFDQILFCHVHSMQACEEQSRSPDGQRTLAAVEYLRRQDILRDAPDLDRGDQVGSPTAEQGKQLLENVEREHRRRVFSRAYVQLRELEAEVFGSRRGNHAAVEPDGAALAPIREALAKVHSLSRNLDLDLDQALERSLNGEIAELDEERLAFARRDAHLRLLAVQMATRDQLLAVPIVESPDLTADLIVTQPMTVAKAAFLAMPSPSASTPWESIVEYRHDEEARNRVRLLRNWVNCIARENLRAPEIADRVEYLCNDYATHMRKRHRAIALGLCQHIIVLGVEMIEQFPIVKVAPLVKAGFSIYKEVREGLSAESSSPGREVAYLSRIKGRS